jgi:hypothetical protein
MRDAPAETCPLCGRKGTLLHEGVGDRLFGGPGRQNSDCEDPRCGLLLLDLWPLESDLRKAPTAYDIRGDDDAGERKRGAQARRRRAAHS